MECSLFVASGKWRTLVLSPNRQNETQSQFAATFSPVYSAGELSIAIQIMSLSSADKYSLRKLADRPVYGSLGLLRVANEDFIGIIAAASAVGSVEGHVIYQILKVSFYSLNDDRFDDSPASFDDDSSSFAERVSISSTRSTSTHTVQPHPCAELAKYLSGGTFYFSLSWDITKSFQRSVKSAPGPWLSWESTEQSFFWNRFMMEPVMSLKPQLPELSQAFLANSGVFVIAMQGFVGLREMIFGDAPISVALISRLSCRRAGTRFYSRGIDDDGNVSNFVESETIICHPTYSFSYIILRGSVPIFWDQESQRLGYPKIQLTRTPVATQPAFDRHFKALSATYGLVHAVDLLNQKEGQSEQILSKAYEYHSRRFPDNNTLSLTPFDVHAIVKYFDYDRLESLFHVISRDLQVFGYHVHDTTQVHVVLKAQKGSFRVSCLDCLDRTNLVQGFVIRKVVDLFIRNYLLSSERSYDSSYFQTIVGDLWASNGDQLSLIYAGSGAQKSSFTRTGKYSISSLVDDMKKAAQRLYSNSFKDKPRQQAVDLLLGKLPGQQRVVAYDPLGQRVALELKQRRRDISDRTLIRVQIVTWNTNGVLPSSPNNSGSGDLVALLGALGDQSSNADSWPHIIAFGFQEIVSLNPSQIVSFDPERRLVWEGFILRLLHQTFGSDKYSLLAAHQLVGTSLSIFVRTEFIDAIRNVENGSKKTGMGGITGNKGSVSIRLDVLDTSFCFIASHLAAGQNNSDDRDRNWQAICSELQFSRGLEVLSHDNVFWFGDFNYRVEMDNQTARRCIEDRQFELLLENDQLRTRMQSGSVFVGFSEGSIAFPPTYKFDVGTNIYDTSEKMRIPSWTDRILFKGSEVEVGRYTHVPVDMSDHKPVLGLFTVPVFRVDPARIKLLEAELYMQFVNLMDFDTPTESTKAEDQQPPTLPPRPAQCKD